MADLTHERVIFEYDSNTELLTVYEYGLHPEEYGRSIAAKTKSYCIKHNLGRSKENVETSIVDNADYPKYSYRKHVYQIIGEPYEYK